MVQEKESNDRIESSDSRCGIQLIHIAGKQLQSAHRECEPPARRLTQLSQQPLREVTPDDISIQPLEERDRKPAGPAAHLKHAATLREPGNPQETMRQVSGIAALRDVAQMFVRTGVIQSPLTLHPNAHAE